jgi:N-acyl-D-amino-acid deacylase
MLGRFERILSVGALLSLIVALAGCGGDGDTPTVSLPQFHPAGTIVPASGAAVPGVESFDKEVGALLKKWDIPGAAVSVAKDGRLILARGYGYADFEAKQVMQPDSMFRIGSITKILTSLAVLHLEEEGRIGLDERFLDVLTQYQLPAGADARLRSVTIRQLLQHSGGWDRNLSGDPTNDEKKIADALGIPSPAGCSDIIRYTMGRRLDFDPGTRYAYSNLGYCILGRIIERISGESYETYVRDHVLAPMQVHALSLGSVRPSARGPYEVKYYEYDGAPLAQSVFPGEGLVPLPYGGLELLDACGAWIGSTVDLTRVMTAIDGSRLASFLRADTMAEYTANPHIAGWNEPDRYWYGLGIFVGPGPHVWYHGGSFPGEQSQLRRTADGYTWSIITNSRTKDPDTFAPEMDAAITRALGSGLAGSPTDLYPQYPSPRLPPSGRSQGS